MKSTITIAAIFLAAMTLHVINNERREKENDQVQIQECERVGIENENGSVTYVSTNQQEELIVLATTNGPVIVKCKK